MSKIGITGIKARDKAIKGLHYIATAVSESIGPFGLNILTSKGQKISNDGAYIANSLCPTIEDEFEREGALTVNKSVNEINDITGDGSSTAWALHDAIIKEAIRYLPNEKTIKAKKTYSEVVMMLEKSKNEVIAELEKMAKPITTKEELINSAMVAVEDETLAKLLGSMQWELGPEGIIIAEEVNEITSSIEKVRGIRLDNGFGASHLVTNPEKQSLEIDNFPVLLTNYTIGAEELKSLNTSIFHQLIAQKKTGIIFIARAFTAEAIKVCQESIAAGFGIFPINAPYTNQSEVMHDIESVVGGRYIDTEESSLSDIHITDIGFAKRLVAKIGEAVITGADSELMEIKSKKRAEALKLKLIGEKSEFYKKMIEQRIAQLSNGFAILKIGSLSIINRKRLFDKAEDAVSAVRLAMKGGVVKGAGQAFKEISDKMEEDNILKRPLLSIYNQIIGSAPDGWTIPEYVKDPYLVLKTILEKTCDFCSTFSSINAITTEADKKECYCNKNSAGN